MSFLLLFILVWIVYFLTRDSEKETDFQYKERPGWPAVFVLFFAVLYGTIQIGSVQADSRFFSAVWGERSQGSSLFEDKEAAETELMEAAAIGDTSSLKRLIETEKNLNKVNEAGETALHYAAYNGQTKAALLLLEAGANPNLEDNGAYTPLWITYSYKNIELAGLLLQHGADADQEDQYGESIRSAADKEGNFRFLQLMENE